MRLTNKYKCSFWIFFFLEESILNPNITKGLPPIVGTLAITGAGVRTRTADLRITSALLYQLSYTGKNMAVPTGFEPVSQP